MKSFAFFVRCFVNYTTVVSRSYKFGITQDNRKIAVRYSVNRPVASLIVKAPISTARMPESTVNLVHTPQCSLRLVNSTRTELNWPATSRPSYIRDAFIGHARRRHDSTGCSETRTVGARLVLNRCGPVRQCSSIQLVRCEQAFTRWSLSCLSVYTVLIVLTSDTKADHRP